MKFKKLSEAFVTTTTKGSDNYPFEIWKNPTTRDFTEIYSEENRGLIDDEGNLYIEASPKEKWSDVIHGDLFIALKLNLKLFEDYPLSANMFYQRDMYIESMLAVQRVGDSLTFRLAESYETDVLDAWDKIIDKYIAKCKEKNPHIKIEKAVG